MTDHKHKAAVLVGKKLINNDTCVSRSTNKPADIPETLPLPPIERSSYDLANEKKTFRDEYAVEQEQLEREEGWRENPSVDPETQREIVREYRELHEQFKREGLYQCNYSAYAWESVRYLALFAAFGYFLHIKWYITSATFLGLFWVCQLFFDICGSMLTGTCSNKSCSQHTMLATAASQATSFMTRSLAPSLPISAAASASAGGSPRTTYTTLLPTCPNTTPTFRIFLCSRLHQPT